MSASAELWPAFAFVVLVATLVVGAVTALAGVDCCCMLSIDSSKASRTSWETDTYERSEWAGEGGRCTSGEEAGASLLLVPVVALGADRALRGKRIFPVCSCGGVSLGLVRGVGGVD